MSAPEQNQVQTEQKPSDKELNFRALEAKFQKQLEAERQARLEAEERAKRATQTIESDDDDEPYVDHKKLNKKLAKFGESTQNEIQKAMEQAKQKAKEELKREMWLEKNPDFYDTLQNHAQTLYDKNRELAETLLELPEGFERQKVVYKNIKALGLDKPASKEPSIQEKVDANRRSPYYQPSGIANAPYANGGDFSDVGQKNAYAKMQELKKRLRM